jgi:hypothetical protein
MRPGAPLVLRPETEMRAYLCLLFLAAYITLLDQVLMDASLRQRTPSPLLTLSLVSVAIIGVILIHFFSRRSSHRQAIMATLAWLVVSLVPWVIWWRS